MNAEKLDNWSVTLSLAAGDLEIGSLLALPEWRDRAELEWADGLVASLDGEAIAVLPSSHDLATAIWDAWLREGTAPAMRITRRDATSFLPVLVPVWGGYLSGLEERDGTLRLIGRRAMPGAGRAVCRDAAALPGFAGVPKGSFLPQVFGDVAGVRAVRLRGGTLRARLRTAIGADATILLLDGAVDAWPSVGTVQVGDELLGYWAISPDGTLGSEAAPCSRPSPRWHDAGTDVWIVPEGGYLWAACDHPAVITATYADTGDQEFSFPLESEPEEGNLAGRTAMLVATDRAPVRVRESSNALLRVSRSKYAGEWDIQPPTNADFPTNAFEGSTDVTGAVLSWLRPQLGAAYLPDYAAGPWRFDRIRRAALLLDLYPAQGWDAGTRLRVQVTRGAATLEWFVTFEGYIEKLTAPYAQDGLERESAPPIPYLTLDFDITAQLGGPYGWDWWSGTAATRPTVRLDLVDAPEGCIAVVRGVRWIIEVQPAASVRLTDDIRCDIRGRHRAEDGFCHPADAIRTLLEDPHFAGVPIASQDEPHWEAARDALDARGVRYATAITDGRTVQAALRRALGECGTLLSPEGSRHRPRVLPVWPVLAPPATIGTDAELDAPPRRAGYSVAPGEGAPGVLIATPPADAAWTGPGIGPPWQAQWIAAGAGSMPELAAAWCAGNRIDAQVPIPAPQSSNPIAFGSAHIQQRSGHRGTLRQRTHQNRGAGQLFLRSDGAFLLATAGAWRIWHMPALAIIAFARGAQRIATLDTHGSLAIRGTAQSATSDPHGTEAISERNDGSLALMAQANGAKATLLLTTQGNLRCTGPISAVEGVPGPPASDALNTAGGAIRLAPGGRIIAILSPDNGFRISGSLLQGWTGE
jgi:hypothetical protein